MTITRPDIAEARLDRVEFRRSGAGISGVKIELHGEVLDENGNKDRDEDRHYDWADLPGAWQTALLPILKGMSKEFNNEFANEDTETL